MHYSGHYIYHCCEHHILPDDFTILGIRKIRTKGAGWESSLILESFIQRPSALGGGRAEAGGTFVWSPAGKIHSSGQHNVECGFCFGSDVCGGVWGMCLWPRGRDVGGEYVCVCVCVCFM